VSRLLPVIILFLILAPQQSQACASCGSGGDDPLILYPNESYKLYVSFTQTSDYELIDLRGNVGTQVGPEKKQQLQVSTGMSLSQRLFVTLSLPYIKNIAESRAKSGFGDPIVGARYTIWPQNIAEEYIPQVQLLASARRGTSRSINESSDPDLLDVFGNGYSQGRLGFDLWSGQTLVQYGFAHIWGVSLPKNVRGRTIRPGLETRSTLSVGQTFSGAFKYILGINRFYAEKLTDDGKALKDSEQLNHSVFATFDVYPWEMTTLRMTLSKQAALLKNKNTSRSQSVNLAWMRAF
jgi:hypothetical protein